MRRPVAVLIVAVLAASCGGDRAVRDLEPAGAIELLDVLGGEAAGFARARGARSWRFPEDHGPHETFRNEWWYVTGNLATEGGRSFAYQLTFFRTALAPVAEHRDSAWATNQLYMAHFALADIDGGRFRSAERFGRAALGLAGALRTPLSVWLEDWVLEAPATPGALESGGDGAVALHARAAAGGARIALTLTPAKPVVLNGDGGLSRKGAQPGSASFYYSLTRLETTGTVQIDGRSHSVRGNSWLDREWSSAALEAGLIGWDWFALQLPEQELMLYQLRGIDGGIDPRSSGTWVDSAGGYEHLPSSAFSIVVTDRWVSPRSGVVYPAGWRIELVDRGARLDVRPRLADQELDHAFRYWEGAVEVSGEVGGRAAPGLGFVELTGYR